MIPVMLTGVGGDDDGPSVSPGMLVFAAARSRCRARAVETDHDHALDRFAPGRLS